MLIGYARVSTQEQDTALQLKAFKDLGIKKIYEEKASGVKFNRPVLWQCLNNLKKGDKFVVYKLDRVTRSLVDLLKITEKIEKAGATIKSITEPIDTNDACGRLMFQIIGAMAEFERSLIRERSIAGQNEARNRGVHCGRKSAVDKEQAKLIVETYLSKLHSKDKLTLKQVGNIFNISESTVKRLVYKVTKPNYQS